MTAVSDHSDKLIRMGNQIATFFKAQGEEAATAQVADHLRSFWTPRMRADLAKLAEQGDCKLDPILLAAAVLAGRERD